MSDQAKANGAADPPVAETPRQSLREIAEAAWDEVVEAAPEGAEAAPVDEGGQLRDSLGRFLPKTPGEEPGEAAPSPDGTQPRDEHAAPQQPQEPHPAPQGSSSEAPANWSAEDRQTFAKLPPEGKEFLLRRHSEMEGDYQRRVQANAVAAQFTSALAPVFGDPVISGSLQQQGLSPYEAIVEWAGFQRRALDPNPQVRMQLLQELGRRMGLLDPAATGQMSPSVPGQPQLSEADLKDPAIRYFADYLGKVSSEQQAQRQQLQLRDQRDAERQMLEVHKVTRWSIDSFAEQKDDQGKPLHPHFDAVLPQIIELYQANPGRDLKEAYETAVWMDPTIRSGLITATAQRERDRLANERAKQAVRSNVRGITSPVSKPAGEGPQGLRATIEAAADEIGI